MEKTRAFRRYPLLNAAIIVLVILLAMYIPFRMRMAREEGAKAKPAPGTRLSIFVTDELVSYREPCS